jgi:hypothetical protein
MEFDPGVRIRWRSSVSNLLLYHRPSCPLDQVSPWACQGLGSSKLGLGWLLDHYPTLTGGKHWRQNRNVAEAPWSRCSSRQRHTRKSGFVIGSASILTCPQVKRSKQTALMFSLADFIGYLATCIIYPSWAPFDPVGPRHFLIQAYPPRRVRRPHSESLAGLVRRWSSDLHPSERLCSVPATAIPLPPTSSDTIVQSVKVRTAIFFLHCLSHC